MAKQTVTPIWLAKGARNGGARILNTHRYSVELDGDQVVGVYLEDGACASTPGGHHWRHVVAGICQPTMCICRCMPPNTFIWTEPLPIHNAPTLRYRRQVLQIRCRQIGFLAFLNNAHGGCKVFQKAWLDALPAIWHIEPMLKSDPAL